MSATRSGIAEKVEKLVTKAVMEKNLIEEGDRILVAVSGGKDSTVMAWALSRIRPAVRKNYELAAVHIASDFCACCKKAALEKRLSEWGVSFTDIFTPVIGRLKPGRVMNCYWCSTQRRMELLKHAVERGFNKIALGHHLDDIIETFFMNMTAKGELSTMPILLRYRNYPVSVIRPLGFVEERQIIACAEEKGILRAACTCPFGVNSSRKIVRKRIADFTGNSSAVKRRILRSVDRAGLLAGE
ncbi:MAG: tRNA 2-thiocytidine biosynthesis protein TtcA [Treponema sp.]|jgi:tRNA 2-thiocytidine biosynthesis protein TtcA|nr:tRNA 2-thiocytidine biosynthesis protein TtcA [Treponema sp.]